MSNGRTNCIPKSENTLKTLLDATKSCYYLFNNYNGASVDNLIKSTDTSNVTNMSYMFSFCFNLTTIPLLSSNKVTTMRLMFNGCTKLTTIPLLDTSNVIDMVGMFTSCSNLVTIPALNVSNVTDMSTIFNNCSNLKSILMTGMKVDFDISASTKFERTDLVIILNNLATVTTTQTLTMGATNLAKLTDEDKKIATDKGWTLA